MDLHVRFSFTVRISPLILRMKYSSSFVFRVHLKTRVIHLHLRGKEIEGSLEEVSWRPVVVLGGFKPAMLIDLLSCASCVASKGCITMLSVLIFFGIQS